MDIHEFINRRKDAGIRQDDFAQAMGWSWGTVIDIERGRVPVSESGLSKMFSVLTAMIVERQARGNGKEVAV